MKLIAKCRKKASEHSEHLLIDIQDPDTNLWKMGRAALIFSFVTIVTALWPKPSAEKYGTATYLIGSDFSFRSSSNSAILSAAFRRYHDLIFNFTRGNKHASVPSDAVAVGYLQVNLQTGDERLQFGVDESYSLGEQPFVVFVDRPAVFFAMLHIMRARTESYPFR